MLGRARGPRGAVVGTALPAGATGYPLPLAAATALVERRMDRIVVGDGGAVW
ncbi:hypothetical protein [Longimycelium tulufanense]|uniref:hypothetical protein n=1 Tax=Longimycelium tulufanense TaxID=907463 RepID=UPI00166314F2|nr:hypothetical protein [Longimycelium tulufanense]